MLFQEKTQNKAKSKLNWSTPPCGKVHISNLICRAKLIRNRLCRSIKRLFEIWLPNDTFIWMWGFQLWGRNHPRAPVKTQRRAGSSEILSYLLPVDQLQDSSADNISTAIRLPAPVLKERLVEIQKLKLSCVLITEMTHEPSPFFFFFSFFFRGADVARTC